MNVWTDSFISRHGPVATSFEPSNKSLFTIKGGSPWNLGTSTRASLYIVCCYVVGIVTRPRAQVPWNVGSIPGKTRISLLQTVKTAFGAHSSSYSIGHRESIAGNKEVTCRLATHLHLVILLRMRTGTPICTLHPILFGR